MSDVKLDSSFDWSSIRTGMEQMRSFVSQSTAGVQKDVASMFSPAGLSGLISVAFIEQGISRVVEYGTRVVDLGRRFDVSTTSIQHFGNIAERSGASLDSVAMGFNRLDIARSKALGGNQQFITSFQNLGVSIDDLKNLSPDELMVKIGNSSMNAADMVKILGKNGTELRETLRKLADGTEEFSRAIDPEHLEALKRADDAWKKWKENRMIDFAELAAGFAEAHEKMIFDAKEVEKELEHPSRLFDRRAFTPGGFDNEAFEGSKASAQQNSGSKFKGSAPSAGSAITDANDAGEIAKRTAGLREEETLRDRIAKLEEESAARSRTDQEQLNALTEKSLELHHDLVHVGMTDEEVLKARLAYLENEKQIDELNGKMAKDKLDLDAKITAERQKAAAEADQELARAQEGNKELKLELAGRKDLAEQAKIEFEFDQKIEKAQEALNNAEQKGFTEVAKTNRELIAQLTLEKQNAVAAYQKAAAEKEAADAAALHAQDLKESLELHSQEVASAQQNLADMREQRAEQEQIATGHADIAEQMHQQYAWQRKIDEATDAANNAWDKMNEAYAEGKMLLGDQYAELAKILDATASELETEKQISGELKQQADLREQTRQQENALAATYGSVLQGDNLKSIADSPGFKALLAAGFSETEIWQMFLNPNSPTRRVSTINPYSRGGPWGGHSTYMATPAEILAGVPAAPTAAADTTQKFQTQIELLQQQLVKLTSMDKKLTPVIGGH